jgi:hypothetical protein
MLCNILGGGNPPFLMINSETPYKLAEIIRDTWPQLFYKSNKKVKEKTNIEIKDK